MNTVKDVRNPVTAMFTELKHPVVWQYTVNMWEKDGSPSGMSCGGGGEGSLREALRMGVMDATYYVRYKGRVEVTVRPHCELCMGVGRIKRKKPMTGEKRCPHCAGAGVFHTHTITFPVQLSSQVKLVERDQVWTARVDHQDEVYGAGCMFTIVHDVVDDNRPWTLYYWPSQSYGMSLTLEEVDALKLTCDINYR